MARRTTTTRPMTTMELLRTAPSTIVLDAPSVKYVVELAELKRERKQINDRLSQYKQLGITPESCRIVNRLSNRLEEINTKIKTKKGGKRTRKNKKSHKKRAHKTRTHKNKKHTRRTRKH